ncbi:hypothetical protein [Paludisphaera sp.]|uniref:hypothetical protein n=1 Tax=Paludisphaera sp. TaxID=2017432 RepID=UPI00301D8503
MSGNTPSNRPGVGRATTSIRPPGSPAQADPATLGEFDEALALARADKSQDQARRSLVELGLITPEGALAAPYEAQPGDEPIIPRQRRAGARG